MQKQAVPLVKPEAPFIGTGVEARAAQDAGDVVLAVDGVHVDTAQGLIKAVAATPPGNAVKLTVRRGGQNMDIAVTVGRRPAEQQG